MQGIAAVGREGCYVIRWNFDHHINTTREHFCDPSIYISNRPKHHRVQSGLTIPVATILIYKDVLITLPFSKLVGPSSSWISTNILAVFFYGFWGNNQPGRVG